MKLPPGWNETPEQIPVERQAQDAILKETGALVEPVFDGKVHRFKVEGDTGGEKSGWYVLFGDRPPAGAFGNWKKGDKGVKWHAGGIDVQANRAKLDEIWRRIWKQRDEELRMRRKTTAETCRQIWDAAPDADGNHPYLQRKKVKSHGLKQTGDGRLIMPIYIDTELTSLQYIDADGGKKFQSGGEIKGGYFRIPAGERPLSNARFIVEGYATGASVHEATGCEVWVALNAGNLGQVSQFLRQHLPGAELVIVGDNDKSGVGQAKAKEAAEAAGASVVIPPELGDANDYAAAGKDLRALLIERHALKLTHWLDFCGKPQPINWLIKGWLRESGIMMMFGASGAGKTFIVLDMALSIACPQIGDWQGCRVKHGPVFYFAGEGYAGLRQRLAGWKAHKNVGAGDLYVSENTIDLDTGDIAAVINDIEATGKTPSLIVVDTLIHFMEGDENKAQDTRLMLAACAKLNYYFGCSILLITHTGVAQDAQGRARGSSAWKGAMDIELRVSKEDKDSKIITLEQTKNKDAACLPSMTFEQITVDVPGWLDEDGEQVTTTVIEPCTEDDRDDMDERVKLSANEKVAVNLLYETLLSDGVLDDEGRLDGAPLEKWRERYFKQSAAETQAGKRSSFKFILSKLQDKGLLTVRGNMYRFGGKLGYQNPLPFMLQNGVSK